MSRWSSSSALVVLLRERPGRTGQPGVEEGVLESTSRNLLQLDEHRGVPVEVGDGEEPATPGGQHRLFVVEVEDTGREDRAVRGNLLAETPDVGLAERSLPRERLPRDEPRAVPVPESFDDFGQLGGEPSRVVEALTRGRAHRGVRLTGFPSSDARSQWPSSAAAS